MPDILLCRTPREIPNEHKRKIALFCNVEEEAVISAIDIESTIYEIPLFFREQGLDKIVLKKLGLESKGFDRTAWKNMVDKIKYPNKTVRIAVIGKYIELQDAYKSIYEALVHGGGYHASQVQISRVESEDIEERGVEGLLDGADGILVPGGFGSRGIEGKIKAVKYAREKNIPFFGICLGMQCAVIEFARNVCGMKNANSTEFVKDTPYPVICLLEEQINIKSMGGTMRLGAYPCKLVRGTKAYGAYGKSDITERHRHRYEFNNIFIEELQTNGMIASGTSPDGDLVEIIELVNHPWFVACQFHPEFKSRPRDTHPLFRDFVGAAVARQMESANMQQSCK
jgi:CTP synthase